MKCPEWLLEAMRKGEGVKCWVWDDSGKRAERTVVGFTQWLYPFMTETGAGFKHAEPYTEPAHTFKPFDRVLVRDRDKSIWDIDFFSYTDEVDNGFMCIGSYWNQCIPYEGNESLLGTTDSPK